MAELSGGKGNGPSKRGRESIRSAKVSSQETRLMRIPFFQTREARNLALCQGKKKLHHSLGQKGREHEKDCEADRETSWSNPHNVLKGGRKKRAPMGKE